MWRAVWDTPQIPPPTPRGDTSGLGVLPIPNCDYTWHWPSPACIRWPINTGV